MKVVIFFSGLFALVRGAPPGQSVNKMHVVLVNATYNRNLNLPEHEPLLAIPYGLLGKGSAQPDRIITTGNVEGVALFKLSGTVLSMEPGDTNDRLNVIEGLKGEAEMPSELNARDIAWLPDLGKITGHAFVNPAYLSNAPAGPVSARVDIIKGEVAASHFHTVAGEIVPFWFKDDVGAVSSFRQAIADGISWTIHPRRSVLTLQLKSADGGIRTIRVVANSERPSEIAIGNKPPDLRNSAGGMGMDHFRAFYELLTDVPTEFHRPLPSRDTSRVAVIHPLTGDCPPALLYSGGS